MKIVLIMPGRSQMPSTIVGKSKPWLAPGLFDVAAIMRTADPNVEIKVIDELCGEIVTAENLPDADLYGISGLTTSRLRAYALANMIHEVKKGKVIAGGMDVTACHKVGDHERFLRRFDAIVTGLFPVETCQELFSDLEKEKYGRGHLKSIYLSDPEKIDEWIIPAYDMIDPSKYFVPYSPLFSRGCPWNCFFCTVNCMCYKPVSKPLHVIEEEFRQMPWLPIMAAKDDCFGWDFDLTTKYVLPLIKKRGSILVAELPAKHLLGTDERGQLLEPMAKSGCGIFYIGVENMQPTGKKSIPVDGYEEIVSRAHKLGSMVIGSFTIGSRADDTVESFLTTVEWSKRVGFDVQQVSNIAALPGSRLQVDSLRKGTMIDFNPEHFGGEWPTVEHAMTAKERIDVWSQAYHIMYSKGEIAHKMARVAGLVMRRRQFLKLLPLISDSLNQIRRSSKSWTDNTGYEYWLRTRWETDRP